MAKISNKNSDAVSNRLNFLKAEKARLSNQLSSINNEINTLSTLTEEERNRYISLDISLYPEIPTRIKTIFNKYASEKKMKTITAKNIYDMGKDTVSKIYGIGYWSIIDLTLFFESKGLNWQ